jgi:polar amino acid transport system permease protein
MTRTRKPTFTPLDVLLLLVAAGFLSYLGYRLFFALNYRWNWGVIATYLVRFDAETGRYTANVLLQGFFTTIKLSLWGTILAALLGLLFGLLRLSPSPLLRLLARTYVETIRNTPPLVLVFIFYYFVSDRLLGAIGVEELVRATDTTLRDLLTLLLTEPKLISPFLSGVLTLALFQGAYLAEIVRAGIEAVNRGQWEAGRALGLSERQLLHRVVMPQATRIMLPPLANEFINTIKWSSIVSIISIQELTFQGLQVMASTQAAIEIWLTISLLYLLLCLSLSLAVRRLEKRFALADGAHPDSGPR